MITTPLRGIVLTTLMACIGGSGKTPPPPPTSVSGTTPTGDTGTVEMASVQMLVWEDDRQCYGVAYVNRPAEHWTYWIEENHGDCNTGSDGYDSWKLYTYGTADGTCVAFQESAFREGHICYVTDPWLLDCAEVTGCCDRFDDRVYEVCHPDSDYQP